MTLTKSPCTPGCLKISDVFHQNSSLRLSLSYYHLTRTRYAAHLPVLLKRLSRLLGWHLAYVMLDRCYDHRSPCTLCAACLGVNTSGFDSDLDAFTAGESLVQ